MNSRNFAFIFGIVYLGLAILSMMPGFVTPLPTDAPPLRFDVMDGELFGVFPVNMLLTLLWLATGAMGLGAFMGWSRTRMYARSVAFIFAALGVMGLVHGLDTLFGLMPLQGPDVWLHLGTATVAAYFGFRSEAGERRRPVVDRRRTSRAPISNERRQGMYDRRRSDFIQQA